MSRFDPMVEELEYIADEIDKCPRLDTNQSMPGVKSSVVMSDEYAKGLAAAIRCVAMEVKANAHSSC